jgi:hypothetical protein
MKFEYKPTPPFFIFLRLAKYDIEEVDHYLTLAHESRDSRLETLGKLSQSDKIDGPEDYLTDDFAQLDDFAIIASEFAVIGLWRSIELYRRRAMLNVFGQDGAAIAFKNKKFKEYLAKLGIVEETLGRANAVDELRCLNNAIKHTRHVTGELSNFGCWRKKKGEELGDLSSHYERLKPLASEYLEDITKHLNDWWRKKDA